MKATELRIGNYILFNNFIQPEKTVIVDGRFLLLFNKTDSEINNYYEPIPINEEWLLKAGFPKHKSIMDLLWDYTICLERQYNELFVVNIESGYIYKIDFLHQLQNLYFALKGEELTID